MGLVFALAHVGVGRRKRDFESRGSGRSLLGGARITDVNEGAIPRR